MQPKPTHAALTLLDTIQNLPDLPQQARRDRRLVASWDLDFLRQLFTT